LITGFNQLVLIIITIINGFVISDMNLPNQKEIMDFRELLEKYQALLIENSSLKEEIKSLHVRMFEKMYNKRLSGYASIG